MDSTQQKKKISQKRKMLVGFLVILGFSLIFFHNFTNQEEEKGDSSAVTGKTGNSIGDIAPDFTVTDLEGKEVRLSDFKGNPVLLNFWATWCPFCVDELPLFAEVQKELEGQYVTLAINRGESESRAQSYTEELGVTSDLVFLFDKTDRIYSQYSGFAMPVSIFIDSDGVIKDRKQGPLSERELRQRLESIIPSS